jgi:hypothetical protein
LNALYSLLLRISPFDCRAHTKTLKGDVC